MNYFNYIYNYIKDKLFRKDIIKNLFTHWLTSGFIIAIALLVLDIISFDNKSIGVYAFFSGSFFLINLLQFNVIKYKSETKIETFIIHSILGGLFWVTYSIIMYLLYINNFSANANIFITLISVVILTFIYIRNYKFIDNILNYFIK